MGRFPLDRRRLIRLDAGDATALFQGQLQVAFLDRLGAVLVDGLDQVSLVHLFHADGDFGVVLDDLLVVFLRLEKDAFSILLVLESQFMEPATALAAVGADAGLGHVARQGIGGFVDTIVNDAGAKGPVDIAALELDDDFHADPRDREHAPVLATPGHHRPYPARRCLITFAQPVPGKDHLDAAIFVGVNFLVARPRHLGGQQRWHLGPGCQLRRPKLHRLLLHLELGLIQAHFRRIVDAFDMTVHRLMFFRAIAGVELHVMRAPHHQIIAIRRRSPLVFKGKDAAGGNGRRIGHPDMTLAFRGVAFGLLARLLFALVSDLVMPRHPIPLDVLVDVVARGHRRLDLQIGTGQRHVIVPQRYLAGYNPPDIGPFKHRIAVAMAVAHLIGDGKRYAALVFMRRDSIRQHDLFRRGRVVEKVIDPLLLHQPADEIPIAFAILHAIFAQLARVVGLVGDIGELCILKDLLDDLDRGHVLKHPVVRSDGQQPRPGPQLHREQVDGILMPQIFDRHADAAELEAVVSHERDRRAQNRGRIKVAALGINLHPQLGDLAELVAQTGANANQVRSGRTAQGHEQFVNLSTDFCHNTLTSGCAGPAKNR